LPAALWQSVQYHEPSESLPQPEADATGIALS